MALPHGISIVVDHGVYFVLFIYFIYLFIYMVLSASKVKLCTENIIYIDPTACLNMLRANNMFVNG